MAHIKINRLAFLFFIMFFSYNVKLSENSGDGSPCIRSTVAELTYHTDTDPCQPGRLSDRYTLLQCFAWRCVPFVSLQALKLRRVFTSAFPSDQLPSHTLLSARCFRCWSVISGSEGGHIRHQATGDYRLSTQRTVRVSFLVNKMSICILLCIH